MQIFGIALGDIIIVGSVGLSIGGFIWKLSKYDSRVKAIGGLVDSMKNQLNDCMQFEDHNEKINQNTEDIKDIKKIITADQVDRADWRARSEMNQDMMKENISKINDGIEKMSEMFTSFISKAKG